MSDKKKQEFKEITLIGKAYYCKPWEDQAGQRYGPEKGSRFDVTLVDLDEENMQKAIDNGRSPTMAARGSSKFEAGHKEYFKFSSLFKIDFKDSQLNVISDNTLIGNGSLIKVYLEVRPIDPEYQKSNTHKFYVTGVQLLKMEEMPDNPDWDSDGGGQKGANMTASEGGYVTPETNSDGLKEEAPESDPITDDELPF